MMKSGKPKKSTEVCWGFPGVSFLLPPGDSTIQSKKKGGTA